MSTKYSNKFTEQEWVNILTETNGVELKVIAEKYGITVPCLKYQMKKRNFKHIPYRYRVNNLNENYFETIDSEEKAYFLGFLLADGCVAKSSPTLSKPDTLSVILNVKDIEILEFMKNQLEADNKIIFNTTTNNFGTSNTCRFVVRSTKLCSDLIKAGITPRKTGKERIPEMSSELMPHYIRGFFDGDGCITKSRSYATVGFTSCYECLEQLNIIFHDTLNLEMKNIHKESGSKQAFRLYYGKISDVCSLYDYFYDNATIYLKRKKDKFEELSPKIQEKIIAKKEGFDANIIKSLAKN